MQQLIPQPLIRLDATSIYITTAECYFHILHRGGCTTIALLGLFYTKSPQKIKNWFNFSFFVYFSGVHPPPLIRRFFSAKVLLLFCGGNTHITLNHHLYKHCHFNQQIVNHFSHNLIPTPVKYVHLFHLWLAIQSATSTVGINVIMATFAVTLIDQPLLSRSSCRLRCCMYHRPSARSAWIHPQRLPIGTASQQHRSQRRT